MFQSMNRESGDMYENEVAFDTVTIGMSEKWKSVFT